MYTGRTGVFDGTQNMSDNAVVAATKKESSHGFRCV